MKYYLVTNLFCLSLVISSCASKSPLVDSKQTRAFASNDIDNAWIFGEEDEKRDENISKLKKLSKAGTFYFEVQFAFIVSTPNYSKIDRLIADLEAKGNKLVARNGIRNLEFAELSTASFEFEGSLKETELTPEKLINRLDDIAKWQFLKLEK